MHKERLLAKYKKSLSDPISSLPKEALDVILEGTHGGTIEVYLDMGSDYGVYYNLEFEGYVLPLVLFH